MKIKLLFFGTIFLSLIYLSAQNNKKNITNSSVNSSRWRCFNELFVNKLNEINGFKTYTFGSSPKDHTNLILEIDDGNTKLYSLNQSNINYDGADLEYLRITFCKEKLSAITIQTKNATGDKFLKSLKENYGEPAKTNPQKKVYEWLSNKCQLVYECNSKSNDASVSFYAKTICKNNN